jgi:hypothetical protein
MKLNSSRLHWNSNELFCQGSRKAILRIIPDAKYPAMWRVERPDGQLTDMVNHTRAKDAALSRPSSF